MNKFVNFGIGMVFIVVCLLLCACTQKENLETSSNETKSTETELEEKTLLNYSNITVKSSQIASAIQDPGYHRQDFDMKIYAYGYYDITGNQYSMSGYTKLSNEKALKIIQEEIKEQTGEQSEEATKSNIAKIEADFFESIQLLESNYQKNKYKQLQNFLAQRNIHSSIKWEYGQTENVYLIAYEMGVDDLIALQESGLHPCYIVSATDDAYDLN